MVGMALTPKSHWEAGGWGLVLTLSVCVCVCVCVCNCLCTFCGLVREGRTC